MRGLTHRESVTVLKVRLFFNENWIRCYDQRHLQLYSHLARKLLWSVHGQSLSNVKVQMICYHHLVP